MRLLLISADVEFNILFGEYARKEGYKLRTVEDGLLGYKALEQEKPDLVVLDSHLPSKSGFDLCLQIRNNISLRETPTIIVSSQNEEVDIILGFELGADDYIVKPISMRIVFAKIKSILRRITVNTLEGSRKVVYFDGFSLELSNYRLKKGALEIPLTMSEFGILRRLLLGRGQAFSRSRLLDDVHSDEVFIVDRNIDVHIAALRKKIGSHWIETVRGIGYRFVLKS